MFGLLERNLNHIKMALSQFKEIDEAIIFGSRAMGNYKQGSDVDMAILGSEITRKTILRLCDLLNEEYPLPYFFDVIHYETLVNEKLKEHIKNEGKKIY